MGLAWWVSKKVLLGQILVLGGQGGGRGHGGW